MNQNRASANNTTKIGITYKIILVILVLIFVGMGIGMINEIRDYGGSYSVTFNNMEYRLDDRNFYRINTWICQKEADFESISPKEKELGNVGKYYYQAIPYYALKAAGNSRSDDYKERMEEYKSEMGEYQNQADKIDEILGNWNK